MMVDIVVADDHPIVRQGMRTILESEDGWHVVGEATEGLTAVEIIEDLEPDVAFIDVMLPDLHGLEVVRRVTDRVPSTKVVILSMHADDSYVVQALRNGAKGYVLKATSTKTVITAVREVIVGKLYLSPPLTQQGIDHYLQRASDANQPIDRYELLTSREREVLHLVAQGETNNQIAERLSISRRTVESHRANLMRKLKLQTTSELHYFVHNRGLISQG